MNNQYNVVNGTSYHRETALPIIDVLERVRNTHTRVRLYYGDVKTGVSWNEENDVYGYIGRSTGTSKIPLLIHNSTSHGGGILDHCIIRIIESKSHSVLYTHPKFRAGLLTISDSDMPEYSHNVERNGKIVARFKTCASALRYYREMLSYDTSTNRC